MFKRSQEGLLGGFDRALQVAYHRNHLSQDIGIYADLPVATDVEWQLYVEEGDERVVAATFKAVNRMGGIDDRYFFVVYGRGTNRLRGTIGTVEDPDFDVSGSYFGTEMEEYMVKIGLASDPRVTRVVCETNKGRACEAKFYGRFWIVREKRGSDKYFPDVIGYDVDGNKLYHVVFPEGRRIL